MYVPEEQRKQGHFTKTEDRNGFTITETWDGYTHNISIQKNNKPLPMCACDTKRCVCNVYLRLRRYIAQQEQRRLQREIQAKTNRQVVIKTYDAGRTYWCFLGNNKAVGDTPTDALRHMLAILHTTEE